MDKKKKCVYTLQHNEFYYLPIWIKWYGETFKPEDMYIMAHNSSPEMLEMLKKAEEDGINVEYLNTEVIFDHDWLNEQVHRKQRELLERYEWVLFNDCDELVAPLEGTLTDFIEQAEQPAYRCDGFEVMENIMYRSIGFCKTLLSSIPLTYVHGYHNAIPVFETDNRLRLYHIHKLDFDKAWERNQRVSAEKWDTFAVEQSLGTHNRISEWQDFRDWWFKDVPPEVLHFTIPEEVIKRINGD